MSKQIVRQANGKIGELLVELELTTRGWHVERLDGSTKAANGDLIAIKGKLRKVIQVKTNGTQSGRAFLGYAGNFLENKIPFFNGKSSPIIIDAVVSVTITPEWRQASFHVFTVEQAENYASAAAARWIKTPKKDGGIRSKAFPISPKFDEVVQYHDAWHCLDN